MIYLRTGAPGAGKTLFTIDELIKRSAEEPNRQIYYSGITELKLPWTELDKGEDWHKVPDGSIVMVDECQRIFRPRMNGSTVPDHVSAAETHRHRGIDLYLITQHPMLLDTNMRRLVGNHRHIVSAFGMKAATIHEWQTVKEQCDKLRGDSVGKPAAYPKHVYNLYKSAEIHTHKRRIPFRVWFMLAIPFIIAAIAWSTVQIFRHNREPAKQDLTKQTSSDVLAHATGKSDAGKLTQVEYLQQQIPRIVGQPYTAPQYDAVTTISVAPVPAVCYIVNGDDCRCRTQQGTKYETTPGECRRVVHDGFFRAWGTQDAPVAAAAPTEARMPDGGEPFPPRQEPRFVDADTLHRG